MEAIDVQSTWKWTDDYPEEEAGGVCGGTFTVTSLYIDEDGVAHLSIGERSWRDGPDAKLSVEDFRDAMEKGWVERTNSPHEAWERRQTEDFTVDGRFTGEGLSVSVYGDNNRVVEESWFTWAEMEDRAGEGSDFTYEL